MLINNNIGIVVIVGNVVILVIVGNIAKNAKNAKLTGGGILAMFLAMLIL